MSTSAAKAVNAAKSNKSKSNNDYSTRKNPTKMSDGTHSPVTHGIPSSQKPMSAFYSSAPVASISPSLQAKFIQQKSDDDLTEDDQMDSVQESGNVQLMCEECEAEKDKKDSIGNYESVQLKETEDLEEGNEDAQASVQTKLSVGAPDDAYEKEADAVAAKVTAGSVVENSSPSVDGSISVRRVCSACEEEEEDKQLQRKADGTANLSDKSRASQVVNSPGPGSPLSQSVRSQVEPVLNADLGHVKVHTDSKAELAAKSLKAKAFTHKHNIFLGSGQSANNLGLMAHESTHVIQQTPSAQRKPLNSDEPSTEVASSEEETLQAQLEVNATRLFENEASGAEGEGETADVEGISEAEAVISDGEAESKAKIGTVEVDDSEGARASDESVAIEGNEKSSEKNTTDYEGEMDGGGGTGGSNLVSNNGGWDGEVTYGTGGTSPETGNGVDAAPVAVGIEVSTEEGMYEAPAVPSNTSAAANSTNNEAARGTSLETGGGGTGISAEEGVPEAQSVQSDTSAVLSIESDGATGDVPGFVTQAIEGIDRVYQDMIIATKMRKERIQVAATKQKEAVAQMITEQVNALNKRYDQAESQVQSIIDTANADIRSTEDEHVQDLNDTAQTEIRQLTDLIIQRQGQITQVAEEKDIAVNAMGEVQAQRAIDGSERHYERAEQIVSNKTSQYHDNEGSRNFMERARNEQLPALQGRIQSSGREIANGVRSQAGEISQRFHSEAAEISREFSTPLSEGRQSIIDNRDEAIRAVHEAAQTAINDFPQMAQQTLSQLQGDRQQKIATIQANESAIGAVIDENMVTAHNNLDGSLQQNAAEIEWIKGQLQTGGDEALMQQVSSEVVAQIGAIDDQHETVVNNVLAAFNQVGSDAQAQVSGQVSEVASALNDLITELTNVSRELVYETNNEMQSAVTEGTTNMLEPYLQANDATQIAISDAEGGWGRQIDEQRQRLSDEVDSGLNEQDRELITFEQQLDESAREAYVERDEGGFFSGLASAFSTIGEFLIGVVEGFFMAIGDLFVGLWTLVTTGVGWVIIAIVVVVVVIAVLVFGWAAVLIALAVIGAIIGLGMVVYYVYMAITQPNLTPRERGRLIGRALFEVVMIGLSVAELRALGAVAQVSKFARLVETLGSIDKALTALRLLGSIDNVLTVLNRVDDAAQAMRLIRAVGKFEHIITLLDELSDVGRIISLVDELGSARLVISLISDLGGGAKLTRYIDELGGVANLVRVIRGVGGGENFARYVGQLGDDAVRLSSLIDDVGGSTTFSRYVGQLGDDAARLSSLIDEVGGSEAFLRYLQALGDDAGRLRQLIDNAGGLDDFKAFLVHIDDDIAQLETLLNRTGNDPTLLMDLLTMPGVKLETVASLLDRVGGDMAALARLRTHMDDLAVLDDYLRLAGSGNANALANLMDLAVARGFEVNRIQRLLDLAGGSVDEFNRLTQALNRFPVPTPTAPNGPAPVTIAGGHFMVGEVSVARIVMHRMHHYLVRHVDGFFQFRSANMKANNTLWPSGTIADNVAAYVDEALTILNNERRLQPEILGRYENVTLGNGINVKIMLDSVGGNVSVVSFHPVEGAANVVNFVLAEMQAFRSLITGVL